MRGTTELSNLDLGCGGSRRLSPHLFPPLVEINELIRSDYHEKKSPPLASSKVQGGKPFVMGPSLGCLVSDRERQAQKSCGSLTRSSLHSFT